jgi:WhiB family redox-sensing transcriptional regulator
MRWQDLAACKGMDTDAFFPIEGRGRNKKEALRAEDAIEVCAICLVRQQCLDFSLEKNCTGIFGGMHAKEREEYARNKGIYLPRAS